MDYKKRLKSFGITALSLVGTAFLSVVLTPEWASFLGFANDKLLGWGVPAVIVALVGVLVSEVWKQILNKITISKAVREGVTASSSSFTDVGNELY